MVKNQTPRQVAIRTSSSIAAMGGVILVLYKFISADAVSWLFILLFVPILFGVSYFTIINSLQKFIYRKIKVIYKKISDKKGSPKARGNQILNINEDIISEVDEEVEDWISQRNKEIDQMKRDETYRREFLGNVSHELKTPLTSIQGYIETLLDGAIDDKNVNLDYLHKALKNVNRLTDIIYDLDKINELDSGQMKLERSSFDIVELAKEVIDDLNYMASSYDIKIQFKEGTASKFTVVGDREKIRQVINNLVVNSIKYGKDNGTTQVGFYDMDDLVLVEVSDNGIGIAAKELPRLFERFYRVEKSRARDRGGTGLGLAIVKHIVEAHGQNINVRSLEGTGSTFGFTIKRDA